MHSTAGFSRTEKRAFALISTLLIIAILTIMVVAFMQSMRIDRLTARSYMDKYGADLVAQAGMEVALAKIMGAIPQGANSSQGFVTWGYSANDSFRPFYVGISPDVLNGDAALNTVWLASSASAADSTKPGNLGPNEIMALASDKKTNMNSAGQIDPSATPYYAGWVDVKRTDPATAKTLFLGRFAFWVDDESSKLDMGRVGNNGNVVKNPSVTYVPTPAQPTDPAAPLDATSLKVEGLTPAQMAAVTAFRQNNIWPSSASLPLKVEPTDSLAPLATQKYLLTVDSKHYSEAKAGPVDDPNNLIPYGPKVGEKKMNINAVANANAAQPEVAVPLISQFIQTALPEYNARKNAPPGNVNRIAASIVNYILPNRWPVLSPSLKTAFNNIPQLQNANAWPTYADSNAWYGISGTPRLNEYLVYYGTASDSTPTNPRFKATLQSGTNYRYDLGITRIVEVWNSSDKACTLPNLYLHVFNQQRIPLNLTTFFPYLASQDIALSTGSITLAANEFRAFRGTDVYTGTASTPTPYFWANGGTDPNNLRRQIPDASNNGFVLFSVEGGTPVITDGTITAMNGTARVLDGFAPFKLQATAANGQAGTSGGYSGSGDSADARISLMRALPMWSSLGNTSHTPGGANNVSAAPFQNLNNWFDRPRVGGAVNISPLSAPVHVAHAPMQNIVELGNIFDPSNDTQTNDGRPRGTKTLVIGQFDPFVLSSYSNYLKRGDAALLDIFTIDDNHDRYRLNINVPRPGTLVPPAPATGYTSVSPLQTFWSFLRNQNLTLAPTGVNIPKGSDNPINPFIKDRLVAPNWTNAKPFRNFNDLILLGYKPAQLAVSVPTLADNLSVWGRNITGGLPSLYASSPVITNVNVNGGKLGQTGTTSRIDGNDSLREEAFGRVAHLITFRSYRYRVYVQGQLLASKGQAAGAVPKILARSTQCYLVELKPVLGAPGQISYTVSVTPQS